jgi:signal peptidase I
VNGDSSQLPSAMQRVMAGENGYQGYVILLGQDFLRNSEERDVLPKDGFWAMGDNSKNSLDSRFWGIVPRANLVGTATLVWWPFGRRWGWIE